MGLLLILASLGLGIREEYRTRNGIVTKEQQRSLDMSAKLARQNAERQRKQREEHEKRMKAIQEGRWWEY